MNESQQLANILNDRMVNKKGGANQRLAIMLGWLTKDKAQPIKANIPNKDRSIYAQDKYKFFLEAPFEISNKCCKIFKKAPLADYGRQEKKYPITAEMADESQLRTQKWLQHGCNMFDSKTPKSKPMSFWTENDVLTYIVENDLQICSVYGDIIEDFGDQLDGQFNLADYGITEKQKIYKCTGCHRTGCMLCGFGVHLEQEPNRFQKLKETHEPMYKLLDIVKNNGVTFREAIEWTNKHGNMNIKL